MNYSGTIFLHTKVKELKQMDKSTSKTVQGNGEKAKVTANIQENIEGIFIFVRELTARRQRPKVGSAIGVKS